MKRKLDKTPPPPSSLIRSQFSKSAKLNQINLRPRKILKQKHLAVPQEEICLVGLLRAVADE
jgi:hypothetical protein